MILIRWLTLLVFALGALLVFDQILWPIFAGQPVFWRFRAKERAQQLMDFLAIKSARDLALDVFPHGKAAP